MRSEQGRARRSQGARGPKDRHCSVAGLSLVDNQENTGLVLSCRSAAATSSIFVQHWVPSTTKTKPTSGFFCAQEGFHSVDVEQSDLLMAIDSTARIIHELEPRLFQWRVGLNGLVYSLDSCIASRFSAILLPALDLPTCVQQ